MADSTEYLVIPLVALGAGSPFSDEKAALDAAATRTSSDRTPRAVVQVVAKVKPDPRVALVVSRPGTSEIAREVAP
ncbi:MAG: hypothetical protein ACREP4_06550 [Stenotrophomonas sp.]|uniref:hypothetical protein n=1 Tax=Stenotrophomonas sp. TaxID=69392 RepID=UPI003D6DA751